MIIKFTDLSHIMSYQRFSKYKVPEPHPLELNRDLKMGVRRIQKSSQSFSSKLLKKIRDKSIPTQEASFSSVPPVKKVVIKRTIIRSHPEIRLLLRNIIKTMAKDQPKTDPTFFYANIILPKKKLPELYSKGFYIGSENYINLELKHSASKSLSFINSYSHS